MKMIADATGAISGTEAASTLSTIATRGTSGLQQIDNIHDSFTGVVLEFITNKE
jgi:hypothetical protein